MRAKHYDELLSIYHHSLKDLLDHLGGDTMTQFPFTALLRQRKKFGKFGILLASFLVPMLAVKSDELPDMNFLADNMNNQDPEYIKEIEKAFMNKSDAVYKPRMRGNVIDAVSYGYI